MKPLMCSGIAGVLFLSSGVLAQNHQGIKFQNNLSWQQVQEKARAEKKHIYLEFTSADPACWPCKEKRVNNVYEAVTTGNYFNQSFISVLIQKDRTQSDNAAVRSWHRDADLLVKRFGIEGRTASVILSPDGRPLNITASIRLPSELIAAAQDALLYERLSANYRRGKRDTASLPTLLRIALLVKDDDILSTAKGEFVDALREGGPKKALTKENIKLLAKITSSSKDPSFQFLYWHRPDLNLALQGYFADVVIDRIIEKEEIAPVLEGKTGQSIDWSTLQEKIVKKYNEQYATRNIAVGRFNWALRQRNRTDYCQSSYFIVRQFGDSSVWVPAVSDAAWALFTDCDAPDQLQLAATTLAHALWTYPENFMLRDTYASLLYKLGDAEAAIRQEQIVVQGAEAQARKFGLTEESGMGSFMQKRVEKMRRGERFWEEFSMNHMATKQ